MVNTSIPFKNRPFIAVIGHIGMGKAIFAHSLGNYLAQHVNVAVHIENATRENPYLEDFYKSPERWSFHSQMHIMIGLARDMLHAWQICANEVLISDHLPGYEDIMVYSQVHHQLGYLHTHEWQTLKESFALLQAALPHPDITIFLKSNDLQLLLKEINCRGRPGDQSITSSYLEDLDQRFSIMTSNITNSYQITVTYPTPSALTKEVIENTANQVMVYLQSIWRI